MKIGFIIIKLTIMVSICSAQEMYKKHIGLMGCQFDITVVAPDKKTADFYMDTAQKEMYRIEKLISSWDPNSQTSAINRNAGIKPVTVDRELFDLVRRAIKISIVTDGAFDISYASMDRIWNFDGSMIQQPSVESINKSVSKVGFENIQLNEKEGSIYLKEKGMKIGFGAIGKGYAADKAKILLQSMGVVGGIINASGDMTAWGKQSNGEDWKIAITNPLDKSKSYGLLPLKKGAVVTSGNYEKFVVLEGKRYTHIIDPRSGYPTKGILSVTMFSASAELADAMATSVFVMGIEVGLDRINQLSQLDCIIVDDQGQLHYSDNIKIDKK